jgi:hypothetical protein
VRTCCCVLLDCSCGVPVVAGLIAHISVEVTQGGGGVDQCAVALERALGLGLDVRGSVLEACTQVRAGARAQGLCSVCKAGTSRSSFMADGCAWHIRLTAAAYIHI